MKLPPLPLRTILAPEQSEIWGYTLHQMQAYGQQCREAALEEAARLAATTCHHEAAPFADGFNLAAINIEKMIRSLK